MRKYIILAGLLTVMLSGCQKEKEIAKTQESTIAVETTKESTEAATEKTIEAEMESIEAKTEIDVDTGELAVLPDAKDLPDEITTILDEEANIRRGVDAYKGMYAEGSYSLEEALKELDWLLDGTNTSAEQRQAYIDEIKSAKPVVQETKPAPTKPVETKPAETAPVVQESQSNHSEVPAGLEGLFMTDEEIEKHSGINGTGGMGNLTEEEWNSIH